jgi:uncharacterized glyoxalase superfamily protein PhnB
MTSLFAYLSYREAPAGINWLEAIGFRAVTRQPGDGGTALHAELKLHDAVLLLASADADYTVPPLVGRSTESGLYLLVEDVGAIYSAAVEAGATAVLAPETTEWGTTRSRPRPRGQRVVIRHLQTRRQLVSRRPLGPEATTRSRRQPSLDSAARLSTRAGDGLRRRRRPDWTTDENQGAWRRVLTEFGPISGDGSVAEGGRSALDRLL